MNLETVTTIDGHEYMVIGCEELIRYKGKDIVYNKIGLPRLLESLSYKDKFSEEKLKSISERVKYRGVDLLQQKEENCMCFFDIHGGKRNYKVHLHKIEYSVFSLLLIRLTDEERARLSAGTLAKFTVDEFFTGLGFKKPEAPPKPPKKDYH